MGQIKQTSGSKHDHVYRLFPQGLEHVKPILYVEYGIDWVWRQIARTGNLLTLVIATSAFANSWRSHDSEFAVKLREVLLARSFLVASVVLIAVTMLLDAHTDIFGKFPGSMGVPFPHAGQPVHGRSW